MSKGSLQHDLAHVYTHRRLGITSTACLTLYVLCFSKIAPTHADLARSSPAPAKPKSLSPRTRGPQQSQRGLDMEGSVIMSKKIVDNVCIYSKCSTLRGKGIFMCTQMGIWHGEARLGGVPQLHPPLTTMLHIWETLTIRWSDLFNEWLKGLRGSYQLMSRVGRNIHFSFDAQCGTMNTVSSNHQ